LKNEEVPFLPLWEPDSPQIQTPQRAWQKPPIAIAALLAGMQFAIVAASGPAISKNAATTVPASPSFKIESLSVQISPTTQAMISLKNLSDNHDASLTMTADGEALHAAQIQLPPKYESQIYFADVPFLAKELIASVQVDGHSESIRANLDGGWPRIHSSSLLSPELHRMIDVYARHRPPGDYSRHIAVRRASEPAFANEPEAIISDDLMAKGGVSAQDQITVADSPLTRSVDWPTVLSEAQVNSPPSGDWQALLTIGTSVVLAKRDTPVRQVWFGFDSEQFPHRPDFVLFWTSVFDWLGGSTPSYHSSAPPNQQNQSAANVPQSVKSLSGQSLLIALLLLGLSAAVWKPTPFAHPKLRQPKPGKS
jgi:hypothetical protein